MWLLIGIDGRNLLLAFATHAQDKLTHSRKGRMIKNDTVQTGARSKLDGATKARSKLTYPGTKWHDEYSKLSLWLK